MGKISDEIRNDFVCGVGVDAVSYRKLLSIADRIDSEMMELPKDADGVPIHVGDTVYLGDWCKVKVTRIGIGIYEDGIYTLVFSNNFSVRPGCVSHTKPDSFERIADDIEKSAGLFISEKTLDGWAYRIRKLAAKED